MDWSVDTLCSTDSADFAAKLVVVVKHEHTSPHRNPLTHFFSTLDLLVRRASPMSVRITTKELLKSDFGMFESATFGIWAEMAGGSITFAIV